MQDGDAKVGVTLFEAEPLPIIVIRGVREPVEKIRCEGLCRSVEGSRRWEIEQRIGGERERFLAFFRVRGFGHGAIERVVGKTRGPGLTEPLLEGSALIDPAVVIIARSDAGTDSREMRRMRRCGEHLGGSHVGATEHADAAVGVWERGRPLDAVVAILRFMNEGIPLAFRGKPPTDILYNDDVTLRRCHGKKSVIPAIYFAVGRSLQKDREFSGAVGTIDIRAQSDSVAHLGRNVAIQFHGISFGAYERREGHDQKQKKSRYT